MTVDTSKVPTPVTGRPNRRRASDPTDLLWVYEQLLESEETTENVVIPKWLVPTLPPRFERTWLGTLPEGAVDSFRDMDARIGSAHINKFPGYWELHIDSFNPHYYPVSHVLTDTDVMPALQEWVTAVTATPGTTTTSLHPSTETLSTGLLVPLRLTTVVANRATTEVVAEIRHLLDIVQNS